jgi:serine/threonine-protein kinase
MTRQDEEETLLIPSKVRARRRQGPLSHTDHDHTQASGIPEAPQQEDAGYTVRRKTVLGLDGMGAQALQEEGQTQDQDVLLRRYRMMGKRDQGGFGTVAACWDTRLQRPVAIKGLVLGKEGSASTITDALAEARTASKLTHPNIVAVHDFEVEGPYAYLVMEYIDGLNMAKLLKRVDGGVLTFDETAYLVSAIGGALAYAHEERVLHLDIKPTNILIDRHGVAKLCDFGMARLASAAGYGDARGGTVGYMPPEQILGDMVDERSDVFSLAVVAWQALFGYSPFAADTAEQSLALIEKGPVAPSTLDPSLAGPVEDALLTALSANASWRMPSVQQLVSELVPALGDPERGRASLEDLVSQKEEDQQVDSQDWEGERLPLSIVYPWLPGAFARVLAAGATLTVLWRLLPAAASAQLLHGSLAALPLPLLAVAASALTALWPPLGSLVVTGALCATCVALSVDPLTPVIVIFAGIVCLGWWLICGIRSWLSTPTLLLPFCMGAPIAGAPLAGYAFGAPHAMMSACVSWLAGSLWPGIVAAGCVVDQELPAMLIPLLRPASLFALVGCMAAAGLCATLTRSGTSTTRSVAGQLLCCSILVFTQLTAGRMENGGIWPQPSWASTGVALLLCVSVCVASVLYGPRDPRAESEVGA